MTRNSYGNKQYIAVVGIDKALALAKAIMEAHDCQVLIQNDDANIYIVSWANRYGSIDDGECFVFMNEADQERWDELNAASD